MKEIAKTPQYEIAIDETKNRVYLKVLGYWRNAESVANYISDWRKTLALLKPNFTLLTDLTTMLTHPAEVLGIHKQAQELLTENGLRHTAEVAPKDFVTAFQLSKVAKSSQMPVRQFPTVAEAEAFLDTLI
ncbi:hypothetical protein QNI16_36755 [Cytophagaceae bacterium YF14B1]|uniref:Uncharacterized protein n=1 Tax=Xanthocytophaga flava TaxID=3048013 RepID=A0AAE3UB31_9BACT|nr:hypothetical protein [Xanthocytophaga flavus]MDJ1486091.1 hypothetical protein [Xanthocytophaga flavus]